MRNWDERAPDGLRASPTGRVPQWVLDEATGRQSPVDGWRSWAPVEPAARRRRRNWTGVGGALMVVTVVGVSAIAAQLGLLPASPAVSAAAPSAEPAALGMPHPTPGVESADVPLGTSLPAPAEAGEYGFVQLQADGVTPVGYDPCRPIHYVVRPDNAPAGGGQVIHDAVARTTEVTGFRFIDDGPTDEPLSDHRAPYQPGRYGDRWAPVLLTWDTEAEQPDLIADVAGFGR